MSVLQPPASAPQPMIELLEPRRLLADPSAAEGTIVSLTLLNAQTDEPVPGIILERGTTLDLATTGRLLSIRADIAGPVGSVRFNYDGDPNYQIENFAPYAIAGDSAGGSDYLPWTPTLGTHSLIVTPYTQTNGAGSRLPYRAITFTVVDSTPQPEPLLVRADDAHFSGGSFIRTDFAVSSATDPGLYQSYRTGKSFNFSQFVPSGPYTLKLHFAEPHFRHPGQRTFDVFAEGTQLLSDYDIVADVGTRNAAVKTFRVEINDDRLDLSFIGVEKQAIVSAIELIPLPRIPAEPAPLYVNAGGPQLKDSIGRVFNADSGFTGGAIDAATANYLNTPDDALFNTFRSGTEFTFSRAVANGNYTLWLEFADPLSTHAGQRTFDIFAEAQQILDNYDIIADAGVGYAACKRFDVSITDATLDLSFHGESGDAIVSAIVLMPTDIPAAALPYAGVSDFSDPTKHAAALTAWSVASQNNLRQIGQAVLYYANAHKGAFPDDFSQVTDEYFSENFIFANPRIPTYHPRGELSHLETAAWNASQNDYLYRGAGFSYRTVTKQTIIAYENPDRTPSDTLYVVFADGHVQSKSRDEIIAMFGGSPAIPIPGPRPIDFAPDADIVASQSNLRVISQTLLLYSNENRGRLPPDLGTLFTTQTISPEVFLNPRGETPPPPPGMTSEETAAWINAHSDYIMLGAGQSSARVGPVLAYEDPSEMAGGINILFADGRVEFREMRWALETLARAGVL